MGISLGGAGVAISHPYQTGVPMRIPCSEDGRRHEQQRARCRALGLGRLGQDLLLRCRAKPREHAGPGQVMYYNRDFYGHFIDGRSRSRTTTAAPPTTVPSRAKRLVTLSVWVIATPRTAACGRCIRRGSTPTLTTTRRSPPSPTHADLAASGARVEHRGHAQPGAGWSNTWNVTGDASRALSNLAVLASCSVM